MSGVVALDGANACRLCFGLALLQRVWVARSVWLHNLRATRTIMGGLPKIALTQLPLSRSESQWSILH